MVRHCYQNNLRSEAAEEKGKPKGNQEWGSWEPTFSMTDAVGWHGPPNMDDATAVGHFILIGVLASVIIIQGMHNTQIEKEFVQNLREMKIHESPYSSCPFAALPCQDLARLLLLAP